jgi:hypothetical protein
VAIMADSTSATGSVAESNAVIPVSPASGRAAQQATAVGAAIPAPSALLSLGAPIPSALTYDAAGLLRALESSVAARALLSNGANINPSSVDVAALTGVNAGAARSGQLNASVSLQTVPFNAQFAVQNLLAGQDSASRSAAIAALQTDALNQASTSLTSPSTAAAVINASGSLQTLTPDAATAALAGLQGTDLGLAAAGLGVNTATPSFLDTTGLLLAPGSDSTSQALTGLLTSNLSLANVQFSANLTASPAVAVGAAQTLGTVLASNVDLTTAAAQAAASSVTVTTATTPIVSVPAAAPVTVTSPVIIGAAALPSAAAATATATGAAIPAATAPATASTPVIAATAATAETVAGTAPQVAAATAQAVNLNFLVDVVAQARNTITANPNYAAMAATLYANAAIFRAMPESSRGAPAGGGAADLPPPVAATLNVRAARPV